MLYHQQPSGPATIYEAWTLTLVNAFFMEVDMYDSIWSLSAVDEDCITYKRNGKIRKRKTENVNLNIIANYTIECQVQHKLVVVT